MRKASEYDEGKDEGKNTANAVPADAMKSGVGGSSSDSSPPPCFSAPRSLLLHLLPHLQFRHRAHRVLLCLIRLPLSQIR